MENRCQSVQPILSWINQEFDSVGISFHVSFMQGFLFKIQVGPLCLTPVVLTLHWRVSSDLPEASGSSFVILSEARRSCVWPPQASRSPSGDVRKACPIFTKTRSIFPTSLDTTERHFQSCLEVLQRLPPAEFIIKWVSVYTVGPGSDPSQIPRANMNLHTFLTSPIDPPQLPNGKHFFVVGIWRRFEDPSAFRLTPRSLGN